MLTGKICVHILLKIWCF